jgi:hypothetical protein
MFLLDPILKKINLRELPTNLFSLRDYGKSFKYNLVVDVMKKGERL